MVMFLRQHVGVVRRNQIFLRACGALLLKDQCPLLCEVTSLIYIIINNFTFTGSC